jgi:hypothetical protein
VSKLAAVRQDDASTIEVLKGLREELDELAQFRDEASAC